MVIKLTLFSLSVRLSIYFLFIFVLNTIFSKYLGPKLNYTITFTFYVHHVNTNYVNFTHACLLRCLRVICNHYEPFIIRQDYVISFLGQCSIASRIRHCLYIKGRLIYMINLESFPLM